MYRNINEAMYNAAYDLSEQAYFSNIKSESEIKNSIIKYYDDDIKMNRSIQNQLNSVDFHASEYMASNDIIKLKANYNFSIPTVLFTKFNIHFKQQVYIRGFTGNTKLQNNREIVYITKNGTVYHTYYNCTYLTMKVEKVNIEDIDELRNSSGGKYYLCNICSKETNKSYVYITSYGNSYHYIISCSAIKRNIIPVDLKEVNGRNLCDKCQKRKE